MAKRTDIHAPSKMDPSEYRAVLCFSRWDDGPVILSTVWIEMTKAYRKLQRDPMFRPAKNGGCKLCGQTNYNEGVVFEHLPTGELIELGWMCAAKVEMAFDNNQIKTLAKERKKLSMAFRERCDRRARLRAFVSEHQDDGLLEALRTPHPVVQDIRSRVARWGGLSDKQIALVRQLAARRREQNGVVPELGNSRVTIEGEVVSVKEKQTDYGPQAKMLLKIEAAEGIYKLYGTCPAALLGQARKRVDDDACTPDHLLFGELRGKRVQMEARITRSRKDASFGFISRPTKAKLLS